MFTKIFNFFKRIQIRFGKYWGVSSSIDLYECDPDLIKNEDYIKQFVKDLCVLIDMKTFGDTVVVNFGEDPRVAGFSMTQLIETSLVSAHFANASNAIYLDIFSCKKYDTKLAYTFAKKIFKAKKGKIQLSIRK
jgi:S-adenosylmethionine/arginine decarboxylase-like enzyme